MKNDMFLSLAMRHYSFQPGDRIFIKAYGSLSFARNMSKNVGKYISKNLSSKYSQKRLDQKQHSRNNWWFNWK